MFHHPSTPLRVRAPGIEVVQCAGDAERVREMNTQWEGGSPLTPGTRQKGVQLRCILVRAALPEGSRPGLLKCRIGMGKKEGFVPLLPGPTKPVQPSASPSPPSSSNLLRSLLGPLSRSLLSVSLSLSKERGRGRWADSVFKLGDGGAAHGPLHKISLKTPPPSTMIPINRRPPSSPPIREALTRGDNVFWD